MRLARDWKSVGARSCARLSDAIDIHGVNAYGGAQASAYRGHELAQHAVRNGPDIASVQRAAGLTAAVLGELDRAAAHYRTAIALNPDDRQSVANLAFIAFARQFDQADGQIYVFFIMTLAAAEAAVGLAEAFINESNN